MQINVHSLPRLVDPRNLQGATVIVVDLLRASTTICTALAVGADCVMPFAEIDETLAAAERHGRDAVLLGGERHGKLIPGFDLGNSPAEYSPEAVGGRRILFTTTNGAKALRHARYGSHIFVGALVNRRTVVSRTLSSKRVEVLCAGTDGEVAPEDLLAAGAIIEAVIDAVTPQGSVDGLLSLGLNQTALAALRDWNDRCKDDLPAQLGQYQGGRNLLDIGLGRDIETCSQVDVLELAPRYDPASGEIRPA